MSTEIKAVLHNSPAHDSGIKAGEWMTHINGHPIRDVLDYKFYSYEPRLEISLENAGVARQMVIEKLSGEDLGLDFDTYLMDEQKSCSNKCIFCFIDQLPKNMRSTLYFKDDDARLSFLMGNYISMTNLSDADAQRIIDMRVSPLNISVHTTNPQLRATMLGNKNGGSSLRHLKTFCQAGISMKCQIVMCPGHNDGEELLSTLCDLSAMYPAVQSVSVVPVGLTRYRQDLCQLKEVTPEIARQSLEIIDACREINIKKHGTALCYAGDELYLKAGMVTPGDGYYEDYAQLENGVGIMTMFEQELMGAIACEDQYAIEPFTVATGESAAPFISVMIDEILKKCNNSVKYSVIAVKNKFFGQGVNVAGLVTGGDIIEQLRGRIVGERLLIPMCMLRHGETVFLDDVSVEQLQTELGVKVVPTEIDGGAFLDTLIGI